MELSQEKWNLILDLKDMVNSHSQTINKMAKILNSQSKQIKDLENKLKTEQLKNRFGGL